MRIEDDDEYKDFEKVEDIALRNDSASVRKGRQEGYVLHEDIRRMKEEDDEEDEEDEEAMKRRTTRRTRRMTRRTDDDEESEGDEEYEEQTRGVEIRNPEACFFLSL